MNGCNELEMGKSRKIHQHQQRYCSDGVFGGKITWKARFVTKIIQFLWIFMVLGLSFHMNLNFPPQFHPLSSPFNSAFPLFFHHPGGIVQYYFLLPFAFFFCNKYILCWFFLLPFCLCACFVFSRRKNPLDCPGKINNIISCVRKGAVSRCQDSLYARLTCRAY